MKKIYFDLETEGLPLADLEKVMPEFEAPGNIKDPVKIEAAIKEKRADWIDKAALKAITGKIVAFTFAVDGEEPRMVTGEEKTLVEAAIGVLSEAVNNHALAYTWGGSRFDLPFIGQRGAVHSMGTFGWLGNSKGGRYYFDQNFVDAQAVWLANSPDSTGSSLKAVAAALGVGEKIGDGKDFAALLKTNPEEAKRYAVADVTLLRDIVRRMGI